MRPLNVTNTDNRLIASAVRLMLEPIIGPLITRDQCGFIAGRSMLANIIDIDEAMVQAATIDDDALALFYDSAAWLAQLVVKEHPHSLHQQLLQHLILQGAI